MRTVTLNPITQSAFAPFGDLIAPHSQSAALVNGQCFERFDGLADVDCGDAPVNVGLMRCATVTPLPTVVHVVERHPLASQAFLPLDPVPYVVVVAAAGADPDTAEFTGFAVPPRTGVNFRAGTWHVPMLGSQPGQTFAVIDRVGADNCDEHTLTHPLHVQEQA